MYVPGVHGEVFVGFNLPELPFFLVSFNVNLPDLAATAVALASGKEVVGLKPLDELGQPWRQGVCSAFWRHMQLVWMVNDIVVISALVFEIAVILSDHLIHVFLAWTYQNA